MQAILERFDLRSRIRAASVHLLISAAVAALAAALVFMLWYPGPYRMLAGGRELFLLVVSVDVVLGPMLTFTVFNVAKGRNHLHRDLAIIAILQTAALVYGLHTVYVARPVALVFEIDRFRVVTAIDVHLEELPNALPEYRRLPLTGPWLLAARRASPGDERNDALFMALRGIDIGQRPPFWAPYAGYRGAALSKARPIEVLTRRYPARSDEIDALLLELRLSRHDARFLPVVARGDWIAVLDVGGDIAGYAAFDGFF